MNPDPDDYDDDEPDDEQTPLEPTEDATTAADGLVAEQAEAANAAGLRCRHGNPFPCDECRNSPGYHRNYTTEYRPADDREQQELADRRHDLGGEG